MYFPYLRCKQFELLALKEISPLIKKAIICPVLEPVKKSTGGFERSMAEMMKSNMNFSIIVNPVHGEFDSNPKGIVDMINTNLPKYDNFQFGLIINQFVDLDFLASLLDELKFERPLTLIHSGRVNDIDALRDWVDDYDVKFNLFSENFPVRRYRGVISADKKVLLDDKFKPQVKNADYEKVPDEFFSEDYLYFEEDGYVGFGDYLTVGDDYVESGWLPYAIAIHLTYRRENGQIWIRHFVSDSNSDTTDVAGKFGEALEKLIDFIDKEDIYTQAANEFRALHKSGHYPGLGSLKKLSIKHHIELIYDLLK